ncbi:CAMK/CAMKL/CHK1 protein kinase [Sphaeroforma arctica JP610]|uniref:CAMK/CAMKL/CHK1 protein kinase n=1 Tax=Sphaeroforma arctica JP610 TaxID=667725 RepID=A0A0L0FNQ5_9EUKA|nr:CAMK/CAMKL/CHK1 protein kinase [Sphaeroforma arctica JP610]KNC78465.1 CAMK/CAMKL/CHK1 protein kinase [Sphaeroforma arctica JP610]|eukprot:XP_014152367.1 CAMK/CAMKL/CHK1 protein kinase [Sphaeroforma arctica JP610]
MSVKKVLDWMALAIDVDKKPVVTEASKVTEQASKVAEQVDQCIRHKTSKKHRVFKHLLQEYVVLQNLTSGSTATIFLAQEAKTGRVVVIKEQLLENRDLYSISREAAIHSMVHHENVIDLIATSRNHKVMVLVQEYLSGGELFDIVVPDVGLDTAIVKSYVLQLSSAVGYLHNMGIAHRDIKPENIVLDESKSTVKLIDLGLSEVISSDSKAIYKRHIGTIPYMAPELLVQDAAPRITLDLKKADVWALGIVMYCLLVGRFPWSKANANSKEYRKYQCKPEELLRAAPWTTLGPVQRELLVHMLDINPESRWSVNEVQNYIYRFWPDLDKKGRRTVECDSPIDSGYNSMSEMSNSSAPCSPRVAAVGDAGDHNRKIAMNLQSLYV